MATRSRAARKVIEQNDTALTTSSEVAETAGIGHNQPPTDVDTREHDLATDMFAQAAADEADAEAKGSDKGTAGQQCAFAVMLMKHSGVGKVSWSQYAEQPIRGDTNRYRAGFHSEMFVAFNIGATEPKPADQENPSDAETAAISKWNRESQLIKRGCELGCVLTSLGYGIGADGNCAAYHRNVKMFAVSPMDVVQARDSKVKASLLDEVETVLLDRNLVWAKVPVEGSATRKRHIKASAARKTLVELHLAKMARAPRPAELTDEQKAAKEKTERRDSVLNAFTMVRNILKPPAIKGDDKSAATQLTKADINELDLENQMKTLIALWNSVKVAANNVPASK